MSRVLPFVIAGVLIAGTTVTEGFLKGRWGEPGVEAAELGKRFTQVPKTIGDWIGVDLPVEEEVRERAGAVNFVNRRYTKKGTERSVDLWLIIGHSRDIIRHTPNICYPNSGFRGVGSQLDFTCEYDGSEAHFATQKFQKEDAMVRQTQRVFWSWNHPDIQEWDAPEKPRFQYGMTTPALYKMYLTCAVSSDEDTVSDNPAAEFAELILPALNEALFAKETPVAPAPATSATPDVAEGDAVEIDDSETEAEGELSL